MSWTVELFSHAVKDYRKFSGTDRARISASLRRLEQLETPLLQPGVRSLVGRMAGFHRLRVGNWRIIFELLEERRVIAVHRIVPRQAAYKVK